MRNAVQYERGCADKIKSARTWRASLKHEEHARRSSSDPPQSRHGCHSPGCDCKALSICRKGGASRSAVGMMSAAAPLIPCAFHDLIPFDLHAEIVHNANPTPKIIA